MWCKPLQKMKVFFFSYVTYLPRSPSIVWRDAFETCSCVTLGRKPHTSTPPILICNRHRLDKHLSIKQALSWWAMLVDEDRTAVNSGQQRSKIEQAWPTAVVIEKSFPNWDSPSSSHTNTHSHTDFKWHTVLKAIKRISGLVPRSCHPFTDSNLKVIQELLDSVLEWNLTYFLS